MHELPLAHLHARPGLQLARLRSDPDSSMLAAFYPGQRTPCWLAKVSYQAGGRARLRRNHAALRHLAPLATALRVPAVLGWHDGGDSTCLIETGVPGWPGLTAPCLEHVAIAWRWLQAFQAATPAPLPRSAPALPDSDLAAPLLRHLAGLPAESAPAVAVHGDFWWGNLLWDGPRLAVVDWNGLRRGNPLDDLFTLVFRLPGGSAAGPEGRLRVLRTSFFEPGPLARLVRRLALDFYPDPPTAGAAFYRFLHHRLRWEQGLEYQPRSAHECAKAREEWAVMLRWLIVQRLPNPFAADD